MANLLSAIESVFSAGLGMVTSVVTAITANPLLLFFAVLPVIGIGIGIFKRLKRS